MKPIRVSITRFVQLYTKLSDRYVILAGSRCSKYLEDRGYIPVVHTDRFVLYIPKDILDGKD